MRAMRIYFAGSIRGGRDDRDIYNQIIKYLKQFGEVVTEHIGCDSLQEGGEPDLDDREIHDRDMNWLLSSDMVVAEVSNPSLGVGYEIGRAIENDIRVICLFNSGSNKNLSAMINGTEKINVINYISFEDLKMKLDLIF